MTVIRGTHIEAVYRRQSVLEYIGNPLIEALPPLMSPDELLRQTLHDVVAVPSELELPAHERLHCLHRLNDLVIPTLAYQQWYQALSESLRQSYIGRIPTDPQARARLVGLQSTTDMPASTPIHLKDQAGRSPEGLILTAPTGMGKTRMLQVLLHLHPQVIYHRHYGNAPFPYTQVVWLYVGCPSGASRAEFCRNLLYEAQEVTGDRLKGNLGSMKLNSLVTLTRQVLRTYLVSVLVIDEVNNLSPGKAGGKDSLLNFWKELENESGASVILSGTTSMMKLLRDRQQTLRRGLGLAPPELYRPQSAESANWCSLFEGLYRIRWTNAGCDPSEVLSPVAYDLTQGITDFAVKLWHLAQRESITGKKEKPITSDLLKKTFAKYLHPLEPALHALRTGGTGASERFEDLLPSKDVLAETLQASQEEQFLSRLYEMMRNRRQADQGEASSSSIDGDPERPPEPLADENHPGLLPAFSEGRTPLAHIAPEPDRDLRRLLNTSDPAIDLDAKKQSFRSLFVQPAPAAHV